MTAGKFVMVAETAQDALDWGRLRWLSSPAVTGADKLTVIDVELSPGKGHDFHKHPDQEEVIVCVLGIVEQWVDRDKRVLTPGDSCFIPAGMVHASFNVGAGDAKLLAILGPCVGAGGYELVDVAAQEPWKGLR